AQTVSRAAKIASMEGHGGVSGTAGQLWNSFRAARQADGAAGGVGDTARRMRTNVNDMYHAQKSMKDPEYQANPYRSNPYMSSVASPADSTEKPALANRFPGSGNNQEQPSGNSNLQQTSQAATRAANDRLNFDFLKNEGNQESNKTVEEAMKQQKSNSRDES
ncbi:MAG TPA: hypothetical protein DEB25_04660, partial [Desulfobulbaceae bacterium]|nr:hypothetical protein [Desulfobulbaceae bacterium]